MSFKCRVCESKNIKQILDLGMQPWGNDFIPVIENRTSELYPLKFVICEECKTCQIDYTIPKEKMFVNHSYMSGTTKTLTKHFENIGEEILKKIKLNNNDYILDIGGNDGSFLKFFKDQNIKVLNVDSGKKQSKLSNERGIQCLNTFFDSKVSEKIELDNNKAKVIHGSGIFFHLEDLKSVFKGIKNLLASDGILVAEFIYLPSMMKNLAFDQIYHEHLLYYSLHSLQNLLDQYDFEIFDSELYEIHGGSCVAYISHKSNKKSKTQKFIKMYESEKNEGFLDQKVYIDFSNKVHEIKVKMINLIKNLKSKNNKIYALGAPVKGSTLLNFMELNEKYIDCAVEINPHKFNTLYPGTKIKVLDQSLVIDPDYYLFLSWNFQKEIISKMSKFVEKGGKFIIPFPEPKLL